MIYMTSLSDHSGLCMRHSYFCHFCPIPLIHVGSDYGDTTRFHKFNTLNPFGNQIWIKIYIKKVKVGINVFLLYISLGAELVQKYNCPPFSSKNTCFSLILKYFVNISSIALVASRRSYNSLHYF